MQLSPPFIREITHTSEEDYLNACMQVLQGEGNFPLAGHYCWHNGIHLQQSALPICEKPIPVCAIADGKVIFSQKPNTKSNSADHPQNYNPLSQDPAWTDNGLVILEHTLQLSKNGKKFKFFSAYMHLSELDSKLPSINAQIKRMAPLGFAGQIYDSDPQIHLEICCDESNLKQLIGRGPDETVANVPSTNGQTDWFFGNTIIYVPAGTAIQKDAPTSHIATDTTANANDNTSVQAPTPTNSLKQAVWVQIIYEKGNCKLLTYDANKLTLIGEVSDNNGEHSLYEAAKKRHDSLPSQNKTHSSIDGWYQLLRFGRVLGTAAIPEKAQHWRQIATTGGNQWVDLNAQNTFKFSDADFLPISGWHFIQDDTNHEDQRCESAKLKELIINAVPVAKLDDIKKENIPDVLMDRVLHNIGGLKQTLKRTVCKFATEWEKESIENRCSWIRHEPEFQENPESWDKFVKHIEAISCSALPSDYLNATWNWHPIEFLLILRTFTVNADIVSAWDQACINNTLPDESTLTDAGHVSLYEYGLRSSEAAVTNHLGRIGDYKALIALHAPNINNRTAILGMRLRLDHVNIGMDNNTENGRGAYRDRVALLLRDKTWVMMMPVPAGAYTTNPSFRYEPRTKYFASGTDEGAKVKGDNAKAVGRLIGNRTYEYEPGISPGQAPGSKGPLRFGGPHKTLFNVLRKTVASSIERFIPMCLTAEFTKFHGPRLFNHSDGYLSEENGFWAQEDDGKHYLNNNNNAGFQDIDRTIEFHRGWATMTGSSACQTFPSTTNNLTDTTNSNFDKFMDSLEPLALANKFQYVLKKMYEKEIYE